MKTIEELQKENESLWDEIEWAWTIIANAYGGDWDLASEASGWKSAAERWRDKYHTLLGKYKPVREEETEIESPNIV